MPYLKVAIQSLMRPAFNQVKGKKKKSKDDLKLFGFLKNLVLMFFGVLEQGL